MHGLLGCTDSGPLKDGCPGTPVTRTGFRIRASENRPLSVLLIGDEHDFAVGYAFEMLAVGAFAVTFRGLHELLARDPTILEGDLLHNRDRQALRPLHGAHELITPEFLRTFGFRP